MRTLIAHTLLAVAFGAQAEAANKPEQIAFKIIVHPENPVRKLSRQQVADLFLQRTAEWENGMNVAPVDQSASAAVREGFSQQVLARTVAAVKSYWQQMIFSGRGVPPPERQNDAAVVAFVLANPGAIGYVSSNAKTAAAGVVSLKDD